jgi:hypothetical protein
MIFFVAFLGKGNEPLYLHSKVDMSEYLHMQMIIYSCLDIVEERKKKSAQPASLATFDMYMGLLLPVDDYRAFCSYSNAHNKTIVICDSSTADSADIKEAIGALNVAFVNAMQNPFQPTGKPICLSSGKAFQASINHIIEKFNDSATAIKRR